jgi:hypothetical protein
MTAELDVKFFIPALVVWPDSASGRASASWSWGRRFESEPWHHGASLGATLWISPVWNNKRKLLLTIIIIPICHLKSLKSGYSGILFLSKFLPHCFILQVRKHCLHAFCPNSFLSYEGSAVFDLYGAGIWLSGQSGSLACQWPVFDPLQGWSIPQHFELRRRYCTI